MQWCYDLDLNQAQVVVASFTEGNNGLVVLK